VGANVVRYAVDRRYETFSVVLGVVALVAGAGEYLTWDVPVLGLALLAFGVVLLLRPLRHRRTVRRAAA
jgi:membrane protein implicated in regulation of membrane protease activity